MADPTIPAALAPAAAEHERPVIRLGGTFRLPRPAPRPPAEIADPGRIRLGGTFRL